VTGGARVVDLIISVAGVMLALLGLVMSVKSRYLDRVARRFFVSIFANIVVYAACILVRTLISMEDAFIWYVVSRIVFFAQAFLSSILTVMLTGFMLYQSGVSRWWREPEFLFSSALWFVYVGLLVVTQFNGFIYTVDDHNRYSRGEYFPVIMIAPFIIMMVNIITLIRRRKHLTSKQKQAFSIYFTLPMIAMAIQGIFFGVHLIVLSTIVAAMFMFGYIVSDQTEHYYAQQVENERLKVYVLLAQIQPHFISNTMTTIKHLFKHDPAKAERALTEFSAYLRHNMSSLTADRPIPFCEELAHVKEYIAIQLLRFEDELSIEYDLEFLDFYIPALTLQPLVENAIIHGVRKSSTGSGIVTITSKQNDGLIEVSVRDDGAGFDQGLSDEENTHTGIQNVSDRLKSMVGGELRIESHVGKGTVVVMSIPSSYDEDGSYRKGE